MFPSIKQHEEESAQSPPTTTAAAGTAAGTATHHNEDFLFKQKLESVKAAVLCGGVGAVARLLAVGAGAVAPALVRDALGAPDAAASSVLFGLASGFAQGALFGLTYRRVYCNLVNTLDSFLVWIGECHCCCQCPSHMFTMARRTFGPVLRANHPPCTMYVGEVVERSPLIPFLSLQTS